MNLQPRSVLRRSEEIVKASCRAKVMSKASGRCNLARKFTGTLKRLLHNFFIIQTPLDIRVNNISGENIQEAKIAAV